MNTPRPLLAGLLVLAASLAPTLAHGWPAHADSGGVRVSFAPMSQWFPAIDTDGAGGVFAVWRDDRPTVTLGGNTDVYAQHLDAAGTSLWAANGAPVCTDLSAQDRPALCGDGAGGLFVAWTDARGTDADVYAQHVNASAQRLWFTNGLRVSRDAGAEDNVCVVPSGAGCIVVWQHTNASSPYSPRLFAQRFDAAGANLWTYGGAAVPGPGLDQQQPAATSDGAGGVIVAWAQPGAPRVIRAQRLSDAGVPLWGTSLAVSDSSVAHSSTFWLRGDGAGGAWVVVHDNALLTTPWARHLDASGNVLAAAPLLPAATGAWVVNACAPDATGRLFVLATNGNMEVVQRVQGAGALDWTPHGLPVSDYDLHRLVCFAITPEGLGGAIVVGTATDTLTGYREVRAQHVLDDGSAAWPVRGVTLSTAFTGAARTPLTVRSGYGAIALWPDERDYGATWLDLYAMRIDASGMLGAPQLGVPGAAPPALALAPPAPNPARGGSPVTLAFALPEAGRASLVVYDVSGRRARGLLDAALPAGPQRTAWDLRDDDGRTVRAGVYFARLEHDGAAITRRVVALE